MSDRLVIVWEPESLALEVRVRTLDGRFCAHLLRQDDGQCGFAIIDEAQYDETKRVVFRKGFATKPDIDDLIARVCEDIMDKDPIKAAAARSLADERTMLEAMLAKI